jgi:hypothetical protein
MKTNWSLQQSRQHVHGVPSQPDSMAVMVQFSCKEIELEGLEANEMF